MTPLEKEIAFLRSVGNYEQIVEYPASSNKVKFVRKGVKASNYGYSTSKIVVLTEDINELMGPVYIIHPSYKNHIEDISKDGALEYVTLSQFMKAYLVEDGEYSTAESMWENLQ